MFERSLISDKLRILVCKSGFLSEMGEMEVMWSIILVCLSPFLSEMEEMKVMWSIN